MVIQIICGVAMDFINFLFATDRWPPRWRCGHWTDELGWLHICSDIAIFLAYLSIPAVLAYWCIKRRDIPFNYLLVLFALFIVFCGSGHLVEAVIFWKPVYRFDGLVKFLTAIISWVTVLALLPVIPKVLEFPKLEKLNELLNKDLSVSRKRLELSFEGSDVGLWDWDILTNQMTFSTFFMQLLGKSANFPDKSFEEFIKHIHSEDQKTFENQIHQHLEQHLPFQTKFRMKVNGKYRWFHARGLAHWDEKGKPIRMAGSITDIQDMIDTQQKLSQTVTELQITNREMEDFLYVVSHDLRAPLINIKGFSEELSYSFDNVNPYVEKIAAQLQNEENKKLLTYQQEVPQALHYISGSVSKIDNLIEALLKLSRLGKYQLNFEEIDTKKLVEEQLLALSHQIKTGNIEIVVGNLPNIVADRVGMQQIFGNLLDNAIKYRDPSRKTKIEIFGQKEQDQTRFTVKDNGIGIKEKDNHKVFEIFKRIDTVSTKGEGMGLAYIRTLIKRHLGSIDFKSTYGVGSEFYFTIAYDLKNEELANDKQSVVG